MNVIKSITCHYYPKDNTPLITILDNGTSYLLFDQWPMAEHYFSDEEIDQFEQMLSDLVGAKVVQEDRDRFVLMTNDLEQIDKLQTYLEARGKDFLAGKAPVSTVRRNLRVKDINALIHEKTTDFFQQEGMKFVKKDLAYVQNTKAYRAEYGFGSYDYHPQYDYYIVLLVRLKDVEDIYAKIDGSGISGMTSVFRLSYFLDKTNALTNNPTWVIRGEEGIEAFSQALMDNYTAYFKEFIPFITQPENMLEFLLDEITKDNLRTARIAALMRVLILMKLLDDPRLVETYALFKEKIEDGDDEVRILYGNQMDAILAGEW